MGTRSLTVIRERWEPSDDPTDLVAIYRQYDGYPEGHGRDLADFLNGLTVVNGIGRETGRIANGPGCFAAQLIQTLKESHGVGGIYIQTNNRDCGAEYVYTIDVSYAGGIVVTVESGYGDEWDHDFTGTPEKFEAFVGEAEGK